MAIKIKNDVEKALIDSIKRYFEENLDTEIGDLKAKLLLDYVLREIGPTIYNQAVADAQAHLSERVADLEGSLYELERTYWKK